MNGATFDLKTIIEDSMNHFYVVETTLALSVALSAIGVIAWTIYANARDRRRMTPEQRAAEDAELAEEIRRY